MNDQPEVPQSNAGDNQPKAFRDILSDAIRYWERRRIVYNLILALVVAAWLALSWPHFRSSITFESFLAIMVLAVLANICYCAAYVVDVPLQYSLLRQSWIRWRWSLWFGGMLFAALLANYWIADEIFPYVR